MRSSTLIAVLASALWATPAFSADEEPPADLPTTVLEEEEIPDIPVVLAVQDPVRELIAQAGNPRFPEQVAQRHFDTLVSHGKSALPTLSAVYRDRTSTDHENWVAARAMGRIGGPGAVNTLIKGLQSKRIVTRLGAVSGLGVLLDPASVKPLERALFDQAMTVRASAADVIGDLGVRSSTKPLVDSLNLPANFHQGQSLFVREHIVVAMGKIGSIGSIDALVLTLGDDTPSIALAAAKSLTLITGIKFRDDAASSSAPDQREIEEWKAWWARRSTAKIIQSTVGDD